MEFVILTAARSGEVRGARWSEMDLDAGLWTVPAERMKARRGHTVPLSPQALSVLQSAAAVRLAGTDLVFPGAGGALMSDMTMRKVLTRAKEPFTVHGFRSSFRDWVADKTAFPREVAEAALAHTNQNEVEAAYQRGSMVEKRRRMMDAWGAYCSSSSGAKVVFLPPRIA